MRLLVTCLAALSLSACGKSDAPTATEESEQPMLSGAPDIAEVRKASESAGGSITATTDALLQRAQEFDSLNSMITVAAKSALEQARGLDRKPSEGLRLKGIPLVVKDNIHVAGMPNTAGTPALQSFIPATDNAVIARLRAQGAIFLGKANMHELAFGITSDNAAFGAVGNPHDPSLFPGGSSGGTAAAIAAGIAPAGLGTDTGGSARIPAALTGIAGFRPSSGRYPAGAVTPISQTRDTVGVLARNVTDIALIDSVIVDIENSLPDVDLSQLRLGVPRAFFYANLDAELEQVIDATLTKLSDAGVELVPVELEGLEALMAATGFPIAVYEVEQELPIYLETFNTGKTFADLAMTAASPDVAGLLKAIQSGEGAVPKAIYEQALVARAQTQALFANTFAQQELDALVFPTCILPARPIAGSLQTVELNGEQVPTFPTYIRNTDPASIAGTPGISVPAGKTVSGLPVGIELDGKVNDDRKLLAIARAVEQLLAK
ncbi:MAG: indoleacetamide hydrolase [Pseudomonadota bacterium]